MKHINFLIKPASGLCNMRCGYCFYEDEGEHRLNKNMGIMTPETSAKLISSAFDAASQNATVHFAFQGGEPTLAGIDYFYNFISEVKKQLTKNINVSYAIQTNGYAIDENWAKLFYDNKFLVGISIDGEKDVHDEFRVDANGKGTYNRVVKTISLLQKHNVDFNLLCVITKRLAKNPLRIYNSLKKLNVNYFQFIPCLDPLETPRGSMPYSLTPEVYGNFLCVLFDAWFKDWQAQSYTSIRIFEDYVHLAMGMPSGTCATSGVCGNYFVAEGDGSLYPCDFFALDQWKLGTVGDKKLEEFAACDVAKQFHCESLQKPEPCAACKWRPLCNGGCKRDWIFEDGKPLNYYCSSFRTFFAYAESRLAQIAHAEIQAMNRQY